MKLPHEEDQCQRTKQIGHDRKSHFGLSSFLTNRIVQTKLLDHQTPEKEREPKRARAFKFG